MGRRRLLVTGAGGMLGSHLVHALSEDFEVYGTGRRDFAGNPAQRYMEFDLVADDYTPLAEWALPDAVVHCAALTNVDFCEEHEDLARSVNGESVRRLREATPGAHLVFISTDAVFPERIQKATEDDATGPVNAYGRSKVVGECLLGAGDCAVRTTIVGRNTDPDRSSFLEWVVGELRAGETVRLFRDAVFTPISIWHLAEELRWILERRLPGVFHVAGTDAMSKHEFGRGVCRALGLDDDLIEAGSVEGFRFKARRIHDQTLDSSRYQRVSGRTLPGADALFEAIGRAYREEDHGRV